MLLDLDIYVFTDHKNFTFNTLKTQCMLHWHTKIEECSPALHYIKGPHNILADNLSGSIAYITDPKKGGIKLN
jgi:hypothetical protein